MKLSKRFAAAIIAICMLLTVMPAFAATISIPNEAMTLPEDGSSVEVRITSTGNANSCIGLVMPTGGEAVLGMSAANITKRTLTEGSGYDGLVVDGSFTINRTHYNVDLSTEASKAMAAGELTHFEFKDLEIEAIRKSSSGQVVLEAAPQSFLNALVSGTAKKVNPEALTREPVEGVIELEETDFVTLTTEQEAELTATTTRVTDGGYDLTASGANAYSITLSAKAGADYKSSVSYNTGAFPEGTIFIVSHKMPATSSNTSMNLHYGGYGQPLMEGAFIAEKSETYVVYGLRTIYSSNNHSRGAHAYVNGVKCDFDSYASSFKPSTSGYWEWDKSSDNLVTLTKDALYIVEQDETGESYSRLAAIALVPADKADDMGTGWQTTDVFTEATFDALHEITANPYVAPAAITRTISVNGVEYEVSSEDAETVLAPSVIDFDGAPVTGVTVADALVKAGIVTDDNKANYGKTLDIKLNGIRVFDDFDKLLVSANDVITTAAITTVDVTNFAPVSISSVYSINGASSGGLKLCLSKTNVASSNIAFCYDGTNFIEDAMKDAKVVGYLEVAEGITKSYTAGDLTGTTVTIPKGARAYFIDAYYTGTVITASTPGHVVMGMTHANAGSKPLHVVLPDGTITQHPYAIQQTGYLWNKAYIVNSQTTNAVKARFVESTGKWQLTTDGARYIYIVKYTVDENGNCVSVASAEDEYVFHNKPVTIDLEDNEKAIVWNYIPYESATIGGTTMIPLTGVLANPAN